VSVIYPGQMADSISDALWEQVAPLVPQPMRSSARTFQRARGAGRKPKADRLVFEAILYKFRHGLAWRALPAERFGSTSAIHARFTEWERQGFFRTLKAAGLHLHPEISTGMAGSGLFGECEAASDSLRLPPADALSARTRSRIIAAADRLFDRNGGEQGGGFAMTTVEAIAREAHVSPRTFFRYFRTKSDVIYLDLSHAVAALDQGLRADDGIGDPAAFALAVWLRELQRFTSQPINLRRLRNAYRSANFVERRAMFILDIREVIAARLAETRPAESPESLRAAAAAAAMAIDLINLERGSPPGWTQRCEAGLAAFTAHAAALRWTFATTGGEVESQP
jgi:AcrR family transcriptional regulator